DKSYLHTRSFPANSPRPSGSAGLSANSGAEPAPFHRPKRVSVVAETAGGEMTAATQEVASLPDMKVSIRQLFGFDSDMEVPAYSEADEHVPDIDPDYRFDKPTTLAILAGFAHNRLA